MSATVSSLFSSAEIKTIVGQLEARLQAPITVEQDQIKTDQAQISAIGQVQGALTSLNGALSAIADPTSINPMTATVSGTAATATAVASASAGSYTLTNIKTAKGQEIYSGSYAASSTPIGSGSGTLTFKFNGGSSATIIVPSSADTVQGVAQAINAAGKGVSAAVIRTASGVQLALQSTASGAKNGFSVTGAGALASLHYAPSGSASTLTLAQAARDASFNLNGDPVTEPENANIQLLKGLTINLSSSGSARVSVVRSAGSLSSSLSAFASKFNNALSVVAKQTEYKAPNSSGRASASASGKPQVGPLLGDVQIAQLQQALLSGVSSAAGSGLSANAIGLTVGSGGQLSFDGAAFSAAYAQNPTGVDNLVQVIAKAVQGVVSGAIGSAGVIPAGSGTAVPATNFSGFLRNASTDLQASVTSLTQEISQQQQIEIGQVSLLEQQFIAAQTATGGANSTLAYIGAVLGSGKSTGG